ncbi:MAG: sialidase family protein [Clostridia bacterium]|nr:sialidase family protein [Clostridia bacterium]
MLSVSFALSTVAASAFAADRKQYSQPFDSGTESSDTFRIPSIITLQDGSVMAAADMRYSHGMDSPQNIDTLLAFSPDGYGDWEYTVVNHFDDYADGVTDVNSASFIDSAAVQSEKTGRIFIITDAFPSGTGYSQAKRGSGYKEIDGVKRLVLTDGKNKYYLGDYDGNFAPVLNSSFEQTEYELDREFRVYKDGNPVFVEQIGSNEQVCQSIFYDSSEIRLAVKTSYLWLRYSDDNGKTWSCPQILNSQVKSDYESFLGICPGRGLVTEVDGKERIIFTVYDNVFGENTSTVYSDDNGETWTRGNETHHRAGVKKTSESQLVEMPDGTLRMYSRSECDYVVYSDSKDGGVSWTRFKADKNLMSNGNCMVSFMNYSKKINGKSVIIGSFPSNPLSREDGILKIGLADGKGEVEWITEYHINDGFFAYSCMTELSDGNIGLLYEDESYHINYKVLTVDENGFVKEINGNDCEYNNSYNDKDEFLLTFKKILNKLMLLFGLM